MALASDIATVLENLGYGTWGDGTTAGGSIFIQHEPDLPAVCTTIYGVGGAPDALTYDGDTYGERPVQIRRRDSDPVALETYLESLYALWSAWRSYPSLYLTVKASTKPTYVFPVQDSNQGSLFIASFNVACIKGA